MWRTTLLKRARPGRAFRSRSGFLRRALSAKVVLLGVPVALAVTSAVSSSTGEEAAPVLLFRPLGPSEREPAEPDPAFPRGARRGPTRPAPGAALCSPSRPVCVHGLGAEVEPTLEAMERAYDGVVLGLRLPPPLPDADPTGPGLDLYLTDDLRPLEVGIDATLGARDSAPAYCVVGSTQRSAADPVRCLVEASLARIDAAETPALRRAFATYVSWLLDGPDARSLGAVDRAQANPQLALLTRDRDALSDAGALFFAHVELAYGSGRPAEGGLALFTQSRSDQASDGLEWNNEPDVLDVLRALTDEDQAKLADLAIDFAIARLFLGDRADGTHLPGFDWLGSYGRVRFDWSVPFSSLPRNLASARALEPLGSAYVWLDVRDAPANTPLVASFSFEAPVRFRFSIVAIDAEGRELTRFDVPFFAQGSQIERTVNKPAGAAALVFVAVNLGAVDAEYPFDPDHGPWEPHGYELYLTTL